LIQNRKEKLFFHLVMNV